MKRKHFLPVVFCAALSLLAACHSSNSSGPSAEEKSISTKAMDLAPGTATSITESDELKEAYSKSPANGAPADQQTVLQSAGAAIKIPEKIKKTADINLTVEDYKVARLAIGKIIKSGNAYIGGENEQNNTHDITNTMIIRVANKDFDALVNNIAGIGAHVNSKNIYTEDVTAQFVDLSARLKSKKEVEQRYIELLKKAEKVGEILEVEEQLRQIREEIEAKEGELKYLNDQVDYSTVNLTFHQDFEYTPSDSPGFFGRIGSAFGNGWSSFLTFIVNMVYAWPVLLLFGVGGYFSYRFVKRRVK